MCFTVDLFEFTLLEVLGASWKCRFMSFNKLGKGFGNYFFKNSFLSPLILGLPLTYVDMNDGVVNS